MKLKARRKETNKPFEEVEWVQLKNSYVLNKVEDMEFESESTTINNGIDEEQHWQYVKEKAAIAAMQGLLAYSGMKKDPEDFTKAAIWIADTFVEELKSKQQ